jgi:uncharacterized protein (TIGR02145 family)
MRTINSFLLLALSFFVNANLCAQVTIGGDFPPKNGAILDLNSTTKGGLLLSNVPLTNLYTIPNDFPDMDSPPGDANTKFTGAIIYHTGVNNIPAGVYIWNGANWTPVNKNCRALTSNDLILEGLPWAQAGATVSFSVSSTLSQRCAEGETYTWSISTGATITPSGPTATATFPSAGSYTVTVTAQNSYMSNSVTKDMSVTVTADGRAPSIMLNNSYGLIGPACLDVMKTSGGGRVDAFPDNNFTKNGYAFIHDGSYSNLSLTVIDPDNLIASITSPADGATGSGAEPITVTFRQDIRNQFEANGADSSTVKLLANYTDSDENDKIAYLEIRMRDGYCVCPVGNLMFMCHNLGAKYDITSPSQIITRDHHGDWYRFGTTKHPSLPNNDNLYNEIDKDGKGLGYWNTTSTTEYPFQSGSDDWDSAYDPCPAGWRLPTNADLEIVRAATGTPFPSSDNWTADVDNYGNFRRFGDYLYLPAAGYRSSGGDDHGKLEHRGQGGYYWSSTANNINAHYLRFSNSANTGIEVHTADASRQYGFSVRCVAL